jgi:hypothetical protein
MSNDIDMNTRIQEKLDDEFVTDEAKDTLRAAVQEGDMDYVRRLLLPLSQIPSREECSLREVGNVQASRQLNN